MKIYSLEECIDKTVNKVGGKALWLTKLKKIPNIAVPDGICVPTDYFWDFLRSHEKSDEIFKLIDEVKNNKITARKNLSAIRKIVTDSYLSMEFLESINNRLKDLNIYLEEGVVVRSSSENEDKGNKVLAGIFNSSLNIVDYKTLETAILDTWASQFAEIVFVYEESATFAGMAVVIQKMIVGDYHGVTFTKAPNNSEYMLLEASDKITNVVDGYSPVISLYVKRDDHSYEKEKVTRDDINIEIIINTTSYIEKTFHMFSDIEWALYKGKLYVLQCRPISLVCEEDFDYKIINQDDVETCERYYLGKCEGLYNKFLGKQYLFRKEVINSNFNVYKQFFIIIKSDKLEYKVINEVCKVFDDAKFVIVKFGGNNKDVMCKTSDIGRILMEYNDKCSDNYIYCLIGEIINANISGYASLTAEGNVVVEYVPARMHGLMRGICPPTQAIIKEDSVEYLFRTVIEKIETVDEETGKQITKDYNDKAIKLSDTEVNQLRDFTINISKKFNNARLEWYFFNGKLYGKDISIESNSLNYNSKLSRVISAGAAKGRAYIIEDLKMLDEVAEKYDLSLYAHSKEEELIGFDEDIKNLINEFRNAGDIILFAERPSIGILYILDWVKGCVFKQGAILSHVGICLREKNKASIVSPESFKIVRNGDVVDISEDGVNINGELIP